MSLQTTKEKILSCSGNLFARYGYKATTIRQISTAASVNIASIHYHFKNKEHLYISVLNYGLKLAVSKYPPDEGVDQETSSQKKLLAFIRSLLNRMLDQGDYAWIGELLSHEMAHPTKALDILAKDYMKPMTLLLEKIIQENSSKKLSKTSLRYLVFTVISQCIFHKYHSPLIKRIYPMQKYQKKDINQLSALITKVSLNTIRNI